MKKRIIKNSSVKNISRFVSIKTNSIHTVESDLEFDSCFHFEFHPQIIHYEAQPIGFKYLLNGKLHSYTPDFLCIFSDGFHQYYEVKPRKVTETSDFKIAFEAQKLAAINMGRDLKTCTESDIQVYPLLDNLKIIHRYACSKSTDALQKTILSLFKKYGELRVSQVVNATLKDSVDVLPALYDLIARSLLNIDLHEPLSWDSTVWAIA